MYVLVSIYECKKEYKPKNCKQGKGSKKKTGTVSSDKKV